MIAIQGTRTKGLGDATRNLAKQLPLIVEQFPEVADCHRGSINLRLDTPLRIEKPDFITHKINWGDQREVFHLTRIKIIPSLQSAVANASYPAWIYGPQNSPHRTNPFLVEIISQRLDIDGVTRFALQIERDDVRTIPMTIVGFESSPQH
jgi:hypothetical protein